MSVAGSPGDLDGTGGLAEQDRSVPVAGIAGAVVLVPRWTRGGTNAISLASRCQLCIAVWRRNHRYVSIHGHAKMQEGVPGAGLKVVRTVPGGRMQGERAAHQQKTDCQP